MFLIPSLFCSKSASERGKKRDRRGPMAHRERARRRLSLEPLENRCLLTAGQLDPTFGGAGIVTSGLMLRANDVALQADGKIIAVGDVGVPTDFAVVRFNNDGSPDSTFGNGGRVTTDFKRGYDSAQAVAVVGDKTLVVGSAYRTTKGFQWIFDIALARYNANGSLDSTFDRDGKVTTSFGSNVSAYGSSLAVQPDGRIVVAGGINDGTRSDIAVARYNTNGSLDTTFGSGGKVTISLASGVSDVRMALQGDGKIVVSGTAWTDSVIDQYDFGVVRLNSNGSLDTTFDGDGKLTTPISTTTYARDIAVQPTDGKIVVTGVAYMGAGPVGTGYDVALARYNTDGSLDSTFDGDGVRTVHFITSNGNYGQTGRAVAVQSDGKIIVGGLTAGAPDPTQFSNFMMVRVNADGSSDGTFGVSGHVETQISTEQEDAVAIAIQPDGRILLAGTAMVGSTNQLAMARYEGDSTAIAAAFGVRQSLAPAAGERHAQSDYDSSHVMAVDDYLTTARNESAGRRSESLADSFLDMLFGLNQRRGQIRALKQSRR